MRMPGPGNLSKKRWRALAPALIPAGSNKGNGLDAGSSPVRGASPPASGRVPRWRLYRIEAALAICIVTRLHMPMRDSEVVAAIVAGDPEGLAEAYDRYASPLFTYCRSLLRESADAADAVQDTFVIAASRLAGLRD